MHCYCAAAVVAVAGLTFGGDAEAKKIRWKMHAAFGKNIAVIGPPPHRVAKAVDEMSGGDFDIKVFEPGALTGGYALAYAFDPATGMMALSPGVQVVITET